MSRGRRLKIIAIPGALLVVGANCIPDLDALEVNWEGAGGTSTSTSTSTSESSSFGTTTSGTGGASSTSTTSVTSSTTSSSSTASTSTSTGGVVFTPVTYTFEAGTNGFAVPYAVPGDWMASVIPTASGGNLVTTIPFTATDGGAQQEIEIARDLAGANWTGAETLEMDLQIDQTNAATGVYEGFMQTGSSWGWFSFGYAELSGAPTSAFVLKAPISHTAAPALDLKNIQRVGVQFKNGVAGSARDNTVTVTVTAVKVY